MYNYYIMTVVICSFMLLLKVFCRKQLCFFTPITIFCVMSLLSALMMIDLIYMGEAGHAPKYGGNYNNISDFVTLGHVFFWFTLTGIIGGLTADLLCHPSALSNATSDYQKVQLQLDKILKNFFFILILNALFGIFRIIIIFKYLNWNSFGDYRIMICFELFQRTSWWENLIFQISNHLYVLAGFYVCLVGAHATSASEVSIWKIVCCFLLFSVPMISMGGRLYILNFLVYFFCGFFFFYNISPKSQISKKILLHFTLFVFALLALVCIIGAWRNKGDVAVLTDENQHAWSGLGYITDSNVILSRCIENNLGGCAPIFESTLGNAATFQENRETWDDLIGYVNGLYSHLYVDFDAPMMYLVWGGFCFLMEAISLLSLKKISIFKLLLCCIIAKIMEEMLIFPSISGNYYCFKWLFIIYILYCLSKSRISRSPLARG